MSAGRARFSIGINIKPGIGSTMFVQDLFERLKNILYDWVLEGLAGSAERVPLYDGWER